MILSAVASPMPGSFIRSSLVAVLRSTIGFLSAGLAVVLVRAAGFAAVVVAGAFAGSGVPPDVWAFAATTRATTNAHAARTDSDFFMMFLPRRAKMNAPPRPPGGRRRYGQQPAPRELQRGMKRRSRTPASARTGTV